MATKRDCGLSQERLIEMGFIPDANGDYQQPIEQKLPTPHVSFSANQPPRQSQFVAGLSDIPELPDSIAVNDRNARAVA